MITPRHPRGTLSPTSVCCAGISLLLLGLALAACQVHPLTAQEKAAALAANRRFVLAERLGDPDSILAIMWDDAVLQPANGRPPLMPWSLCRQGDALPGPGSRPGADGGQ